MGGFMTYRRFRHRNNLMYRKPDDDPDPYWREPGQPPGGNGNLVGDLNRMERDYLNPELPGPEAFSSPEMADQYRASSPAEQCAAATGTDVETVRKVLRYVFLEQP